jgi:hypothetical protein
MNIEIKNRFNGNIILAGEYMSIQDCLQKNRGADLSGADLSSANLSSANLSSANLYEADLHVADLTGANLYEADLYGADLSRANLYEADLTGADLSRANLYGADLSGADLYGAHLYGANLLGADLYGANLSGANLDMSCWPLWCGSLKAKTDRRFRVQLMFHTLSLMNHCGDLGDDEKAIYKACMNYANELHRTDVEKLKPMEEK